MRDQLALSPRENSPKFLCEVNVNSTPLFCIDPIFILEVVRPETEETGTSKRLRDWLTTPRPNGYESLHITVKNRQGNAIEVQIRTKRMDIEAESGNAAHWAYKGIRHEASVDRWLQSVRESLEHPLSTSPEDMPAPPTKDIFVFTPTGELRILASGSSVLDFAFSIHTNIGCKCTGGRVNGKSVQIREKLKTGDVVEILTGKNQRPTRDWLNWVTTSKARSKIRQELNHSNLRKLPRQGTILVLMLLQLLILLNLLLVDFLSEFPRHIQKIA